MESFETLKKANALLFCSKIYVTDRSSLPETIESFVKNSFKSLSSQSKGGRGSSGFNLFKTLDSVKAGVFDYFFIISNSTIVFISRHFFVFASFYDFFKAICRFAIQYRGFFNFPCHLLKFYTSEKFFARKMRLFCFLSWYFLTRHNYSCQGKSLVICDLFLLTVQ